MASRHPRTRIDDELALMLRERMRARGMMQKDLALAAGMTQPQVSVRLSWGGASIPLDQLQRMCAALDMDCGATLEEAARRAAASTREPSDGPDAYWDRDQVDALGRQLAEVMWNSCDDWEFIVLAIDHLMDREDTTFWDARKKQLALMVALSELAYVLGRRYPVRDKFLLKRKLDSAKIIR